MIHNLKLNIRGILFMEFVSGIDPLFNRLDINYVLSYAYAILFGFVLSEGIYLLLSKIVSIDDSIDKLVHLSINIVVISISIIAMYFI
jgi:hypothetical protein